MEGVGDGFTNRKGKVRDGLIDLIREKIWNRFYNPDKNNGGKYSD
jgi:hypothetical protein